MCTRNPPHIPGDCPPPTVKIPTCWRCHQPATNSNERGEFTGQHMDADECERVREAEDERQRKQSTAESKRRAAENKSLRIAALDQTARHQAVVRELTSELDYALEHGQELLRKAALERDEETRLRRKAEVKAEALAAQLKESERARKVLAISDDKQRELRRAAETRIREHEDYKNATAQHLRIAVDGRDAARRELAQAREEIEGLREVAQGLIVERAETSMQAAKIARIEARKLEAANAGAAALVEQLSRWQRGRACGVFSEETPPRLGCSCGPCTVTRLLAHVDPNPVLAELTELRARDRRRDARQALVAKWCADAFGAEPGNCPACDHANHDGNDGCPALGGAHGGYCCPCDGALGDGAERK